MKRQDFEAFEEYRKKQEQEGRPIDPEVKEQAEGELLQDSVDSALEKLERTVSDARKGAMPEGELDKVNVSAEEIPEAIEKLTAARNVLTENLKTLPYSAMLGNPDTTLAEINKAIEDKEGTTVLPEGTADAMEAIGKYMELDPETTLEDIPAIMEEFLSKLKRNKNRPDDK